MGSSMNLDEIPVEKRFRYWRDLAEDLYVPVGLECDAPETFRFWWNGRHLGDTWAGESLTTPLYVNRTRQHIVRSENDALKLVVPLSGEIWVSQDKKETRVRAGQFYLLDPARPYQETITEDLTFIWMHIPRASVTSRIGRIEAVTAMAFGNETPYARLTTEYILSLSNVWDDITGVAAEHANSAAIDLCTMAIWERTNQVRTHSTEHRTAQFQRAKTFIDHGLADQALTLDAVAAALGVSTRYVRALLSEGGLTYRQYVLEQRLARCAHDLADPRMANRTVTDIAYAWAFFDGAHFSRAFKAAYGVSPREYRAAKQKL